MKNSLTRRSILTALLLAVFIPLYGSEAKTPVSEYKLRVAAERKEAVYQRGEAVEFRIELARKGAPVDGAEVSWVISKDGVAPKKDGKVKLAAGVATVKTTLDEPGFLRCEVTYVAEKGTKVMEIGGAAVAPREIKPSMPVPDDFDAYWAEQKRKLAAVPLSPSLSPVKAKDAKLEVFDLKVPALGAPVSGYYVRPVGAAPKSLPAILTVHGAGVRSSSIDAASGWARRGFIALDINAHGLPNGKPAAFYKELADGALKEYRRQGCDARDTIYFREMFLRLVRAIDFLTTQPEWDGRCLVVQGSSQGGYQAIVAAGLDSRVTFFSAGVPAGCDHTAFKVGRISGWPKFVATGETGSEAVVTAVRYYDAVNFATRAKVPGIFTVGFIDSTCPPSSVYAAFNALPGKKEIFHDIATGHKNTPEATKTSQAAIMRHVESMRAVKP